MPPLVAAQRLSKAFGARTLFSGLSFGIERDERIGLIGPNGAGKSTLLTILAQETPPDDGTVIFQGGVSVGLVLGEGTDDGAQLGVGRRAAGAVAPAPAVPGPVAASHATAAGIRDTTRFLPSTNDTDPSGSARAVNPFVFTGNDHDNPAAGTNIRKFTWYGLDFDVSLARAWFMSFSAQRENGPDGNTNQFYGGITWRF